MTQRPTQVTGFRHAGEKKELERLQRLTGLAFESVPESLLDGQSADADQNASADAEAGNARQSRPGHA